VDEVYTGQLSSAGERSPVVPPSWSTSAFAESTLGLFVRISRLTPARSNMAQFPSNLEESNDM
jgi:hypothetical protein